MIIDPLSLKRQHLPVIVLTDDIRGFMGWIIKAHQHGNYNHIMMMVYPGSVVTQGWTYKEVDIEETYMTGKHRLKFWRIKDLTPQERINIEEAVDKDLKAPWYRKMYDVVGIIGKLIRIRKIQSPWQYYCNERVERYLRLIPSLRLKIPLHSSPSHLNKLFKGLTEMEFVGYWFKD